jgi:putative transposase
MVSRLSSRTEDVVVTEDGEDRISISRHPPLHLHAAGGHYWLTGATLHHQPYLRDDRYKEWFVAEMLQAATPWKVEVIAWTLMEHHYHAIGRPEDANLLPRFIGRLHGKTAILMNRAARTPGRQVWRQYWDTLLRSEGDFWSRVNYMWWNPVRHGFGRTPEDWPWTNLRPLMADADETTKASLERFPAPAKLPGDGW